MSLFEVQNRVMRLTAHRPPRMMTLIAEAQAGATAPAALILPVAGIKEVI